MDEYAVIFGGFAPARFGFVMGAQVVEWDRMTIAVFCQ
jgi:hypothetical protein